MLIKHGSFNYEDVLYMPIFERRGFIDILIEEHSKIKENRERESNKIKSKNK
jgi:hypothetical protein